MWWLVKMIELTLRDLPLPKGPEMGQHFETAENLLLVSWWYNWKKSCATFDPAPSRSINVHDSPAPVLKRKLGMTFFLKVSAHALPPLHLLPSFLYLKRGVRVKRKRQPFWLVQWKPTRVVGVGDPGLAGELIVPGTLAGTHSGWQRGLRGFLCEKRFSLSLFVTAVMISLTNMSCSAKREWRLTL